VPSQFVSPAVRVGHSVEVGGAIADILAKRPPASRQFPSARRFRPPNSGVSCDAPMRRSLAHPRNTKS